MLTKVKLKEIFILKISLAFAKIFKNVTKHLGVHLMLQTNGLQDIIYTSMVDDKTVTINKFRLFVAIFKPSVETELIFNEATQNN